MMSGQEAVEAIRACRGDQIIVTTMTGLGFWPDAGPRDFRLLGLMGSAAAIGLGIAIARPDQTVWVVDGDGSLMMQLGVLGAVADAAPSHYVHIVIDNRIYAVSGGQPVPAHETFDWPSVARGAGYLVAKTCRTTAELQAELASPAPGPRMVVARCEPVRPDYPAGRFTFDAAGEGARVRNALVPSLRSVGHHQALDGSQPEDPEARAAIHQHD
jgi:thiamine pyrophosphate-dependent acetolactate synthase large subunit-like protein